MARHRSIAAFAACISVTVLATAAFAQADVARYRAPMAHDGLLGVAATAPTPPSSLTAGLTLGFADNPVVWRYADGTYEPVVDSQMVADIVVSMGLVRFVDIAVGIPIAITQDSPSDNGLGDYSGGGVGDIRLLPRLQLADERTYGYGGSFVSEVTFPSGDRNRFQGEAGLTWHPHFIGSLPLSKARLIASAGYRMRKNALVADIEIADELTFHFGSVVPVLDDAFPMEVIAELAGATAISNVFSQASTSIEALVGGRLRVANDIVLTTGVGAGLTKAIGTPGVRVLLGVAWSPLARDIDHDGILDVDDACPYEPEDKDGVEDDDGCPEWDADRDGDGIKDIDDDCPDVPEDFNSYLDDDGCPDTKELDSDRDGIPDSQDSCPREPEDIDGFDDEDGCPDPDNDLDGIPEPQDQCPTEKETINGIDDYDGCPDEGEGATTFSDEKIELKQTILFETGKAIIKGESNSILDQVGLQILSHPEITKVIVEGHTDSRGSAEDNMFLSQDRADSVKRYLMGRGIPKEKLEAVGFGEERPIDSNNTASGRTMNRRVEFVIGTEP